MKIKGQYKLAAYLGVSHAWLAQFFTESDFPRVMDYDTKKVWFTYDTDEVKKYFDEHEVMYNGKRFLVK